MIFFEQLNKAAPHRVQVAYDIWLRLCHVSMSRSPKLASLHELYEVFMRLESEIYQSFKGRITYEHFISHVKEICKFPEHAIQHCSLSSLFKAIRRYWSFCSYQLLKDLIKVLGTDEDRAKEEYYSKLYDEVMMCGIFNLPKNIYGNLYFTTEDIERVTKTSKLTIIIRMDKDLAKVANVQYVHLNFSKIFDVHPNAMHFAAINGDDHEECRLEFIATDWIIEEFMNIPSDIDDCLIENMHVIGYAIGEGQACNVSSLQ